MKKLASFLLIIIVFVCQTKMLAQTQIVFTGINSSSETSFWRMNVDSPFVYYSISNQLDAIALFSGKDVSPITVSQDGDWYAFLSTRFDSTTQGWEALTIVKSDFSEFETIHDQAGNLIHSEGKALVLDSGKTVVFVADLGNHTRDIFAIHKTGTSWGTPVNLTQNSTYAYNYFPYVSADGLKVLFDASNASFPSTAIGEVDIDGSNLSFPITSASMTNGVAAHSPSYNSAGDIIYEGDDGTERIWRLPAGATIPQIINTNYGNDNSPVALPDGRIASLYLPGSYHQIKIMAADGGSYSLITDTNANFLEVFDVGLSCFSDTILPPNNMVDSKIISDVNIYPNPSNGDFYVEINDDFKNNKIEIYNLTGEKIYEQYLLNDILEVDISDCRSGLYILKLNDDFSKILLINH